MLPQSDRISHGPPSRLLVLSNGHGEDQIALRVAEALHQRLPELQMAMLPLVGEGEAFAIAEARGALQRLGPRQRLPSGGFSNQSLHGLGKDLVAGLLLLSLQQWSWVRNWGQAGGVILAVGDLLPLVLAWCSGAPFAFLGTPKSDYTWASPPPSGWGKTPLSDAYHRCKGSEWDPWEWRLMRSRRCRLVAVRDPLTARGLRRNGVKAVAPGNPMMDGFADSNPPTWLQERRRVLMLPGSRLPEALGNARRLLAAVEAWSTRATTTVLLATGQQPELRTWANLMHERGWRREGLSRAESQVGASACWRRGAIQLLLGPGRFPTWAPWSEVGLATAGTATEQLVGLGIPALSLPGPGPQFKASFARRQSRLLGGAVRPCHTPQELAAQLNLLLGNREHQHRLGKVGQQRMGPSGGSERLAALAAFHLLG
jgi:uncharacterized protein (TIGR03492 family)